MESFRKPARATDPRDFDRLYREQVEQVARWAARLGGAEIDVDDVVQEVFVAVHKQLPKFRGESSVRTWLYVCGDGSIAGARSTLSTTDDSRVDQCVIDQVASWHLRECVNCGGQGLSLSGNI